MIVKATFEIYRYIYRLTECKIPGSMRVTFIPSYWQSKADYSIYCWEYFEIFKVIKDIKISTIYLLLTLDSDGHYSSDYIESKEGIPPSASHQTVNDILIWLAENNLTLSEYDIFLANGTRLKSYFGGDVISFNLPRQVFRHIFEKIASSAEDNVFYQLNHNNDWINVADKIYSIEDFLFSNEAKIFKAKAE